MVGELPVDPERGLFHSFTLWVSAGYQMGDPGGIRPGWDHAREGWKEMEVNGSTVRKSAAIKAYIKVDR